MFSITCRTCAARLKVKSDAAIGQRLACPKCGEMVEVTPPPGWVPPPESAQSLADGSDFDDIDQIIGTGKGSGQAAASTKSQRKPNPDGNKDGPQQPKSPAKASPVNPGAPSANPAALAGATGKRPSGSPLPSANQPASKNPVGESPSGRPAGNSSEDFPTLQISPLTGSDKPLLKPRSDQFELGQPREYLPNPNLPPPDWTKGGNSRNRTLLVSGLLLVGLLGVIVAIIALLNQSQSKPDGGQVAEVTPGGAQPAAEKLTSKQDPDAASSGAAVESEGDAGLKNSGQVTPEDSNSGVSSEVAASPEANTAASKSTTSPEEANDISATAASGNAKNGITTSEQTTGGTQTEPSPETANPSASLPGRDERPVSPSLEEANPLNKHPTAELANPTPVTANEATGQTSLTDRLGKLSQLLAGPGTSLTELGDLAQSERTDRLVGLPRYLITQPSPSAPPNDPWSLPIAEIDYQNVPLHLLIAELSAIAGVPLSLDSLALDRAGIAVDAPVNVQLAETTIGEVLADVLKQLQLERKTVEGVELIQPAGAQATATFRLPLPLLSDPTPEKYQRLAANMPNLIDQVSWTLDTANRKVAVEGTELVVSNSSVAAAQIKEFLEKLTAAQNIRKNRADETAQAALQSRASRADKGLKTVLKLQPTLDQPLEQFLQRVYQESKIAITVDWAALTAAGWSQQSVVPGDFQAETIEQLLRELARSLNATWLEIDEQTFQLTSFQEASRRQLVEVHSLEGLAIGPEPLLEILTQTLGAQVRDNPLIRFLYEPEANALIVVAPQSVQRQFEAIVKRLKQPAPK
jgi:hypothetical protein